VVGQPLHVLGQAVGVQCLDGLHNLPMYGTPPLVEQAAVGDLVRERVLEGVFEIGEQRRLVQELRGLQPPQPLPQRVLG
jgi:hypothetical protein